jgi:hypothetical protein
MFFMVFQHIIFTNVFIILVKELGFLTKMVQWIRGLNDAGSYMYILL